MKTQDAKKMAETMRTCNPILKSWSKEKFSDESVKDTVFITLDLLEYLFELQTEKEQQNEEV